MELDTRVKLWIYETIARTAYQLWHVAVVRYENRLTAESRRPGPEEMAGIFAEIGLRGPFWDPRPAQ